MERPLLVALAALTAAAAVSLSACSRSPSEGPVDEPELELARLQRATTQLERELELARGKAFYLVLDPAVPDLALMLHGAELQRFPILGLTLGRPRVAWIARGDAPPWRGVVWSSGTLEPERPIERVVVEEPMDDQQDEEDPTPPPIPPTAEERLPVPSRYLIRFDGGLSLEIRPREADAEASAWSRMRAWWSAKARDVVAATRRGSGDSLRLRVVLQPEDADTLYRALPPDVRLLVLDGEPPSAREAS